MDYDYRDHGELEEKIKAIANLPTLPHIALRLTRTVSSPDISASAVAALVAQDVSLSAKVLRLANSAFYGVPKSITTLNNAVVILGFKVIHTVVLSLTVFDMFSGGRGGSFFDRGAFWRHSLKCGVISRLLAYRRGKGFALDPEEAFCAGLLHDLGKIVMEQYLNEDFHKALRQAKILGVSDFEAERAALGYTHCDVASWLTATWSLPEGIVRPIVLHHEPEKADGCADAVAICHIADKISNIPDGEAPDGIIEQKAAAIGLDAHDLADIISNAQAELQKASLFIEL